ncbi:MAG: hypothetical protein KF685_10150 [Acidobacteria bacterium]|nr:hypothetical protein [Acidobacteriota bacterium]
MPEGSYQLEIPNSRTFGGVLPFATFFYPTADSDDKPNLISIYQRHFIDDIVIRVPEMLPLKTISGKLVFADGTRISNAIIRFESDDEKDFRQIRALADANGNFSLDLPEQATGRLTSEVNVMSRHATCPKIDELRRNDPESGNQIAKPLRIEGKNSQTGLVLSLAIACR